MPHLTGIEIMNDALTTRELAQQLHTDQTTLRRYLRTIMPDDKPGTGGRWSIAPDDLERLRGHFKAHTASQQQMLECIFEMRSCLEKMEAMIRPDQRSEHRE